MASQDSAQRNEAPANGAQKKTLDETAPIGTAARLSQALVAWGPRLTELAPRGRQFDFRRFEAIVMAAASRTPKLLLATVYSLKQSVMAAAELGLDPSGITGEAYLIPYENNKKLVHPNGKEEWIKVVEATFMPGYKGFLRLAHESGLFRDLGSGVILPDDVWEPIRRGPEKLLWGHVQNEPGQGQNQPPPLEIPAERWEGRNCITYKAKIAPLRGVYAFAKLVNVASDDIVKVIWFPRLEEIRAKSKAGANGPWITDYHEMAQKTAIRNLWKHLPKTEQMARAEELDQEFAFEDVLKDQRTVQPTGEGRIEDRGSEPKVDPAKAKTSKVAEDLAKRNAAARGDEQPSPAPPSAPPSEPKSNTEEASPSGG